MAMAGTGAFNWSSTTPFSSTIRCHATPLRANATSRTSFNICRGVPAAEFCLQSSSRAARSLCERGLSAVNCYDDAIVVKRGRAKKPWTFVPNASAVKEGEPEQVAVQTSSLLKEFLEDLKAVGRVRLIVNTGVAVLESVTSLDKLYYHVSAKGEYANVMSREDNVDFHLLLEKVGAARLVKGKSMKGDIPTYTVRIVDVNDSIAISVLVMWKLGTAGEYDPGQVEGFEALLEKYGEEVKFIA